MLTMKTENYEKQYDGTIYEDRNYSDSNATHRVLEEVDLTKMLRRLK
jgi:hypothetical protein